MAGADYFHCDVCGGKAFYDAHLNWDCDAEMSGRSDLPALDYTGDIRALCDDCAKTHVVVVVEREVE